MRLLVVEDEEILAKNLKTVLEQKGFAVDYLTSAEKAKTRILMYRSDYALILLDLQLPGIDGLTLTKTLRTEGISTPIIIVTARAETAHKIELLNSGADDYVVKPFSTDELVARINSVLRRPPVAQPVTKNVGPFTIDTASRRVRSGQKDVNLTLKEYSLLECFIRRPNEVVTRDELVSSLWDFDSVSWSNVLDVHMMNLRKKLQRDAQFETIRGIGYRLVL